jgi:hypothetical protein
MFQPDINAFQTSQNRAHSAESYNWSLQIVTTGFGAVYSVSAG